MARSRSKQAITRGLADSLDHTVSRRDRGPLPSTVRPLMRTVLGDTSRSRLVSSKPPRALVRVASPAAVVRASGRSVSLQTKAASPFRQATFYKPMVPQRSLDCARRTIRREVLFATDRRRKGSGGGRRKQSKARC